MTINIFQEIDKTKQDINKELRLIVSENYASPAVIKAISAEATNIFV